MQVILQDGSTYYTPDKPNQNQHTMSQQQGMGHGMQQGSQPFQNRQRVNGMQQNAFQQGPGGGQRPQPQFNNGYAGQGVHPQQQQPVYTDQFGRPIVQPQQQMQQPMLFRDAYGRTVDQFGNVIAQAPLQPQQPVFHQQQQMHPAMMQQQAQMGFQPQMGYQPQLQQYDQFGHPIQMGYQNAGIGGYQPMAQGIHPAYQQQGIGIISDVMRRHNAEYAAMQQSGLINANGMMGGNGFIQQQNVPLYRTRVNGSPDGDKRDQRALALYEGAVMGANGIILKKPFGNTPNHQQTQPNQQTQQVNNNQQTRGPYTGQSGVLKTIQRLKENGMDPDGLRNNIQPHHIAQVNATPVNQYTQGNQFTESNQPTEVKTPVTDKKVFMPGHEYPLLVKYGFKEEHEHQGNGIYTREVYQDGKEKEFDHDLKLKNNRKVTKDEDGKEIINEPIKCMREAYLEVDMVNHNCLFSNKIDAYPNLCTCERNEIEHLNRELKIITKEKLGSLVKLIKSTAPQLLKFFSIRYTRMFNYLCKYVANSNVSIDSFVEDIDELLNFMKIEKNIAKREAINDVLDKLVRHIHGIELDVLKEYDNGTVLVNLVTSEPVFFCMDGPASLNINDHFQYFEGRKEMLERQERIVGLVTDVSFKELYNVFEDCDSDMFELITVDPYLGARKMYTVIRLIKSKNQYLIVEHQ